MTCDTARNLLQFRRPGSASELAADDLAALDQHLKGCPACAAIVQRQQGFDAAVAAVMKAVPVPAGLRAKLLNQVEVQQATRFRRRVLSYAALAASLLLTAGIVYGLWGTRPALNPGTLAYANDLAADAAGAERVVQDWLRSEALPVELPLNLDFRHYTFHGTQQVQGKPVPVLSFQIHRPGQRPDVLRLYLIRDSQFLTNNLPVAQESFFTARVVGTGNGVTYLAVYTTDSGVEPFLKPPAPAA